MHNKISNSNLPLHFSDMIVTMQQFWLEQGCSVLQSFDTEVGAATYHPATIFGTRSKTSYNVQFVQLCKRPQDGRAGTHPNRLFTHHQFQIIMQPVPSNIQELVLACFEKLGLSNDDIRFIEDDWKNPTLGAAGIGWEVRCNEMEVLQYTYFQQLGSLPLKHICVELAYGLERLAMRVQNVQNVYDLKWSDTQTYGDIRRQTEYENTLEIKHLHKLEDVFLQHKINHKHLIEAELKLAAYTQVCKMSHAFNLLDAQGLAVSQREHYIKQIRQCTKDCLM